MEKARELFPQPIARPSATTWPWQNALDEAMQAAPDVSPEAMAAARAEVVRARQIFLQNWLGDRVGIFRARGLDAELIGITNLQLRCKSCGGIWLVALSPVATMLDDAAMLCPSGCNVNG
jgi:hypothetical protein